LRGADDGTATILVTGATGFLGGALARTLLSRGYGVRALGRDSARLTVLREKGVDARRIDLRDRLAVVAACAGVDAVVHAGALSSPWGRKRDFHDINVEGTRHVVDGCVTHRVRRLVHISSPSVVFDGSDSRDATEDAPYPRRFSSRYAATKKLAEDVVRGASAGGLTTVTLRPKAIFGPGDTALLPRLVRAAAAGRLALIGTGDNLVDVTYVDNVVHAIMLALDSPNAPGRTYTITNAEHVRLWDVVRRVLAHQGLQLAHRTISLRVALAVAALLEARAWFDGREPALTRYSALVLARTQTYDISAARRDLGYTPLIGVDEALERTMRAMERPRVA
jgi:nucleoside-diphosphate-sugar epimerase